MQTQKGEATWPTKFLPPAPQQSYPASPQCEFQWRVRLAGAEPGNGEEPFTLIEPAKLGKSRRRPHSRMCWNLGFPSCPREPLPNTTARAAPAWGDQIRTGGLRLAYEVCS